MITISNKKIAGLEPRWAPFRGFSLLFDNPGESVSSMGEGWLEINCSLDGNGNLQLYRGFVRFLDEIGRHWLKSTYSFCALPACSYHVTAWDGLSDGHVQDVSADYRWRIEDFLDNLPHSLLTDQAFTSEIHNSPLITRSNWSITFRFEKLTKWGNEVFVARLIPADPKSWQEFRRIADDREALSARLRERFGVKMRSGFSPHMTLGYFANKEYAELATPEIDRWTKVAKRMVGDLTITFSSISLYGFTDMVTFFRRTQQDQV